MSSRVEQSATVDADSGDMILHWPYRRSSHRQSVTVHLETLYRYIHRGMITSLLVGLVTAFVFLLRGAPPGWVLAWGLLLALVAVIRLATVVHVRRSRPEGRALIVWGRVAAAGGFVQALAWLPLLLIASHTGHTLDFLCAGMILGLLSLGGITSMGVYLPAYVAHAVPLQLIPIGWILLDARVHWSLAIPLLLACVILMSAAIRSGRIWQHALDVSRRLRESIRRLRVEKARVQATLESIGDGVLTVDATGRIKYANSIAAQLMGRARTEIVGSSVGEVLALRGEEGSDIAERLLAQCLQTGRPMRWEKDLALQAQGSGRCSSIQFSGASIQGDRGASQGVVMVLRDVTELRGMANAISYQSRYDELTGLLNRREFENRLRDAHEVSRRQRIDYAVLHLDLDQFKLINDSCGHRAGDEMLRQVGGLLQSRVREVDVVARMSGDEFALLLRGCDLQKAESVAQTLLRELASFRFAWADRVFSQGAGIGLVAVDAGRTVAETMAAADAACSVAKDLGRNCVHVAAPNDAMLERRYGQVAWVAQVQSAIDQRRFRLRVQRIQAINSRLPVKAELLASLELPDGVLVAPGDFLPAAESFNMMPAVDGVIVSLAMEAIAGLHPGLTGIDLFSINLSGQSLNDPAMLQHILDEIERSGVDPARLCFEITETAVIRHLDRAADFMATLRRQGCSFALDDFGSGLSSFGYLRTLAVDYLKIDGQFVRNLGSDAINRSMVDCINRVGHTMGIRTVAEFVEDRMSLEALRELGVDYAQGFGIHAPELLAAHP
ncbi:MAG: EAL domain-containing protein [Ectothiorhodospiraceae bacterium]|nr:EAL domain-containing protein [Ectothiorhodospiraceae bacterium]